MKKFKYVGTADAVEVVGLGLVEHGQTVEVDDPELSKGLEAQPDNWEHQPVSKSASKSEEKGE